ncbi:MAG TPA: efflux RND transporter periplasmic adaptor subunit [Xanthobacteraceae bacterium]
MPTIVRAGRRRRGTAAAIALLAAASVLIWYIEKPAPQSASAGPRGIPVTAGQAEARNVPVELEGLGTVQAFNTVSVKSRVDGQITKVLFQEGQEVKAGDPLFQIDPRPFQATLQQAQANKQKDEAQLHSAQLDLARYQKLAPTGFSTRQQLDQQTGLVGQLQGAVNADQAQIESAQLNLDYALIRSPIEGRTGRRMVDIGNVVQTAQNAPLVSITQLRPIFVSFTVPAERLDRIRANQAKAPLTVIAYGMDDKTKLAEGKLTLIDNQVDETTGTIRLKAQFANDDEPLWPGEFVNAHLILAIRENAVTVPAQTVMQGPNGPYVFVLDANDAAHQRPVTVASTQDGFAVIEKGLAAGDRVVVDGQYRLTDGSKVKIDEAQQNVARTAAQ